MECEMKCVYCSKVFFGGAARIRNHLVGGVLSDISKCSDVPDDVIKFLKAQIGQKEEIARKKQRNSELDVATSGRMGTEGGAGPSQASIPGLFAAQMGGKEVADRAIARFFYAAGIPFNVADSRYFKEAIKAVAACGPTYCLPGRKALGTTLINKELTDVKRKVEAVKDNGTRQGVTLVKDNGTRQGVTLVKDNGTRQGVTLVSDGWTSFQSTPIINFLMISSEGSMFLSATDTSGQEKNAEYIAMLLEKQIKEIGHNNVVLIVMDRAASCVAADKLVMKKFPGIVCSRLTA